MHRLFSKREKIIFYATIFAVATTIIFNFLAQPALSKNEELNREIDLLRAKLKKYNRLISQKDEVQRKYSRLSSGIAGADKKEGIAGFLTEIENLAKNANIRIIDIRPKDTPISTSSYQEQVIDLKTEGAMKDYLKFVYSVENSVSLMKIKKIQLAGKPNSQLLDGVFSISQVLIE